MWGGEKEKVNQLLGEGRVRHLTIGCYLEYAGYIFCVFRIIITRESVVSLKTKSQGENESELFTIILIQQGDTIGGEHIGDDYFGNGTEKMFRKDRKAEQAGGFFFS